MSEIKLKPLTASQRELLERSCPSLQPAAVNGSMEVRAVGGDTVELLIYGIIGSSWWGEETVAAKDVIEQLRGISPRTINVRINSHGGTCHDGVAIYNELRRHGDGGAHIIVNIDGVAYSAASMIAMAGDEVVMPSNALMMLHAPIGALYFEGNAQQLEEAASDLRNTLLSWGTALASTYARKTGKKRQVFEDMWTTGKDYMYTAEEAKAFGLCDRVSNLDEDADEDDEGLSDSQATAMLQQLVAAAPQHGMKIVAALAPRKVHALPHQPDPPASASATKPALPGHTTKEPVMTDENVQAAAKTAADEALASLRNRNAEIRAIGAPHAGNPDVRALVDKAIDDADLTVTAGDVGKQILAILAKGAAPLAGTASVVAGADQRDNTRAAMLNAIEARAMRAEVQADNPYRGHTLADLARDCVTATGTNTRGLDRMQIVGLAFTHSTSDFPGLLGEAANRAVLRGYQEAEEVIDQFTRAVSVPDFKPTNLVGLGAFSDLLEVPEGGEFKYGTFSEQSQAMRIATYGRLFSITRQAIINDDLGLFDDVPRKMGQAARRTIGKKTFELLTSNPILADGLPLFHESRGNLLTGSAITTASVDAMRAAMARRKDEDGNTIRVPLKALLTPIALGGQARVVRTSQFEVGAAGARNNTTPNIVQNTFDVIDDGRLDDADPAAWYGIANPAFVDGIVIGYLNGNQTPYLEQQAGFTVDGVAWKVRIDAAPAIADWRGLTKNPGA